MITAEYKEKLEELQSKIDIYFADLDLLQRALTHKSYANENRDLNLKDNERLEFLGDSVLDIVVSEYMFNRYPDYPEGKLAKMRASVVSAPTLAAKARELDLGRYLLLGHGEEMTGGRKRSSILADAFEALVGSIYLDQDLDIAEDFIMKLMKVDIESAEAGEHIRDYKTTLQEMIQKRSNARPEYYVIEEKGPDHSKEFTVEVKFNDRSLGEGTGSSKKEAQQQAAKNALKKLK
ncbi:ribonuclease III [Acetohalobium arabaticum]|uniref:Ribonuclease 3 n=1 Tax=Acetohalobium arabaticum (strain ATCC 49924 / DSM 5501 / Z-7288) TaxID=574087 RepID=D9QPV6_ACEAZ|nr:ribonuclease III [Acetohalobium arabaticum]ADL12547.1 RNAse III [Acetohalobium arabaticum DSM 5501]